MMGWLLSGGRQHRIETMGNLVLISSSRVPAAGLWSLLSVARGFRDRVPDVVSELYPAAGQQGHDDITSIPAPVLADPPSSDDGTVPKWTL